MPNAMQLAAEKNDADLLLYDTKAVSRLLHISSHQAEMIAFKANRESAISFRALASYFVRLGPVLYVNEQDRKVLIESIINDSPAIFVAQQSSLQGLADYSAWLKENHENLLADCNPQFFYDRIEVDAKGLPQALFPFSRLPMDESPRTILIDPRYRFGMPTTRRRIPTEIIFGRYRAGDSVADLAEDYDLDTDDIDEAIRYEILLNTPLPSPQEVLV